MVEALILGKMEESTKVNISLAKSMGSELTLFRAEESMWDSGRTVRDMGEEKSSQ